MTLLDSLLSSQQVFNLPKIRSMNDIRQALTREDFSTMKEQIEGFLHAVRANKVVPNGRETSDELIVRLNDQLAHQERETTLLLNKLFAMLQSFERVFTNCESIIDTLRQQLRQQTHQTDIYRQEIIVLKTRLHMITEQYEKTMISVDSLEEQLEKQEMHFKDKHKEIQQSFRQVQESEESNRTQFETLCADNEELLQLNKMLTDKIAGLQEYVTQLKGTIAQKCNELERVKNRIDFDTKRMTTLEEQNGEMSETVRRLKKQIRELNQHLLIQTNYAKRKSSISSQQQPIVPLAFQASLSEELHKKNGEDFQYNSFLRNGSFIRQSCDSSNIALLPEPQALLEVDNSNLSRNCLDPYFAHFILTSQAVKIREDCQQLLSIDVKPYYHEIVDKKIPMHLWDQWIRNRLKQLLKKGQFSDN